MASRLAMWVTSAGVRGPGSIISTGVFAQVTHHSPYLNRFPGRRPIRCTGRSGGRRAYSKHSGGWFRSKHDCRLCGPRNPGHTKAFGNDGRLVPTAHQASPMLAEACELR